jgi:hypothetical protein
VTLFFGHWLRFDSTSHQTMPDCSRAVALVEKIQDEFSQLAEPIIRYDLSSHHPVCDRASGRKSRVHCRKAFAESAQPGSR